MRNFLMAAFAVLTLSLINAPAQASIWDCKGPAASCAKSSNGVKRAHVSNHSRKAHRTASHKAHGRKHVASRAYSGGGGGMSGMASYYWQGQQVASGGRFNPEGMTAAHKTLPFGTKVRVTNRNNGRSVVVTINDRGPFIKGRIIDLSRGAARIVGMTGSGVAPVSVSVIGRG